MIQSIKTKTVVKPGGFIEIHSNELPEGATVEVIMLIESSEGRQIEESATEPGNFANFVGSTEDKGSFADIKDIDAYIREERDSWDS